MTLKQKPFITYVPGLLLKPEQRIQVSISKGFDLDVVLNGLKLSPIEITITQALTDGSIYCAVSLPVGIIHTIIANDDSLPFCSNTQHQDYKRLNLNIDKGSIIRLESSSTHSEFLNKLRSRPIVIRPFTDSDENKILIAAEDYWSISRSSNIEQSYSAADPNTIPTDLASLLAILEEDIPNELAELKEFENRVKNIQQIMVWYSKKILAREINEYVQLKLGLLTDLSIKIKTVKARLNAMPQFFELLSGKLKSELEQCTTPETAASIYQRSLEFANKRINVQPQPNSSFSLQKTHNQAEMIQLDLAKVMTLFEDEAEYENVMATLIDKSLDILPLHKCSDCDGFSEYFKLKRHKQGIPYSIWTVNCNGCKAHLPYSLHSPSQFLAGLQWNRKNPQHIAYQKFSTFGLTSDNVQVCREKLNVQYKLIKKLAQHIEKVTQSEKGIDNSLAIEQISKLQTWVHYLQLLFKTQIELKES